MKKTAKLTTKGKSPAKAEKNSRIPEISPNKLLVKKTETPASPFLEPKPEDLGVKPDLLTEVLEEIKEQPEVKESAEPLKPDTPNPEEPVVNSKAFEEVVSTPSVSPVKLQKSRSSQKSLKDRKISAELDKIFSESPNKPNLRPSVIDKSVRTVSSSPLKNFYSSSSLLTKKEPLFEQLYKIANKPRPEITEDIKNDDKRKTSPSRRRSDVDKELYEDAMRRASIHHEKDEYSEITTGIKSQQVLAKKFSGEFLKTVESLSTAQISFESFLSVMKSLRFVKDEDSILALKLWNTINDQNSEKISLEKSLSCFLAVLGIYASQVVNNSAVVPKELNFQSVASALPIHLEMRIHKNFQKLNENRRIPTHRVSNSMSSGFSFAPQLNCKSQTLAKKKYEQLGGLSPLKKIEYYLTEKKKNAEKAQKEKLEKQDKELEECTFVPKILRKGASPAKNLVHKTLELYEMAKKSFVKKEAEEKVNE